jgi:hypothetical protein
LRLSVSQIPLSTFPVWSTNYQRNLLTVLPSIVFIHGLTGDREKTWTSRDASEPWPKALLPTKIPNARILTFGYDAYAVNRQGVVSKSRIGEHAGNLLTSLALLREEDDTVR